MREYQTQFEKLAKHREGLFDAFYRSCFLCGMKDAIQYEVEMFYPSTMMEARGLDKLAGDKIIAQQQYKSNFVPFRNMVSQRPPITLAPRTTPIKHLSEAKMRVRREKRIYYNCDEKFTQGHRYVEKKLYLLDVDSPPAPEIFYDAKDPIDDGDIQQLPALEDQPEISLHALARVTTPQTMWVRGFFKKLPLTILIDSGSTHNFIDLRIAKQADCFIHPCSSFEVMIANGENLPCKGKCNV